MFQIQSNEFLSQNIDAYYHMPYVGWRKPGNPDYINDLKNTFNSDPQTKLNSAVQVLRAVLTEDIALLYKILKHDALTVCVVPRAKSEQAYHPNQQLFRSTVQYVAQHTNGIIDGTGYILRHTNTKTTHIRKPLLNYTNDGPQPYPGITAQTCTISTQIANTHVLLIDDIYTHGVNIDEDAISALLTAGARSVTFYAVGKTVPRQ